MSLTARTSWIIERHLAAPLTLAGLAEANGVSRFHLAHEFGAATGRSVMRHVRGRRLSEAAKALAEGAPSILDCALDWGYGSNEAFSRAFREEFGVPPEEVRKRGTPDGLAMTAPLATVPEPRSLGAAASPAVSGLTPRFETINDTWVFVGLQTIVAFEECSKVLPGQWARFMARYGEIEDLADPIPWAVNRGIDDEGQLDYFCAGRVTDSKSDVPKGFARIHLAPARYAIFHHPTHVSRLGESYDAIYKGWLPASGARFADTPNLVQHCQNFDPRTGEGGMEIWMPLAA